MGISLSKNSTDIINESIIDVVISNINNCSTQSGQTQNVDFSGIGIFTSSKQSLSLSAVCMQKVTVNNDLIAEMANQIQQQAEAKGIALLPNFSGSENVNNLKNYLKAKITTSSIQNCVTSVLQRQNVAFSGFQIGSKAEQTAELFSECMQQILNNNKVAQGIVNDVSQTAKSVNSNPLDFLGSIYGIIIMVVILIAIILIAYMFMPGRSPEPTSISIVPMVGEPEPVT